MVKNEYDKAALGDLKDQRLKWVQRCNLRDGVEAMVGWSQEDWVSWWHDGLTLFYDQDDSFTRRKAFAPLLPQPISWDMDRDKISIIAQLRSRFADLRQQPQGRLALSNFEQAAVTVSADQSCITSSTKALFLLEMAASTMPDNSLRIVENVLTLCRDRQFPMTQKLWPQIKKMVTDKTTPENMGNLPELMAPYLKKENKVEQGPSSNP